jgi:hypothetical protein
MTITVSATTSNAPPTLTTNTGALVTQGDTISISASQLNATDTQDGPEAITYVLSSIPAHGTLANNTIPLTIADTFTQNDIDTNKLTYQHDDSNTTTDTFTFKVRDSDGLETATSTFTFMIVTIDTSLTLTSFAKSTDEDTALAFTTNDFTTHITSTSPITTTDLMLVTLPTHGALVLGANTVTPGQTIPISTVSTLVYSPTTDFFGSDSFSWNATIGNGYAPYAATVTITVTAVNDLPTLTNIAKTGIANTSVSLKHQDFANAFTDKETPLATVKIVSLPAHGRLYLNNIAVGEQQEIPTVMLDVLTFVPDNGWAGATTFSWNGSDGTSYAPQPALVTLTISQKSNSRPVLSSFMHNGKEDTPLRFTQSQFATPPVFTDSNEDDSLQHIRIATLPAHGVLNVGNAAVRVGQQLTLDQINALVFVPDTNWNGSTSFLWNGSDGTAYAAYNATATLNIAAVNDAPTLTPIALAGDVNTPLALSAAHFTQHYLDSEGDRLTKVRILSLPSSDHGALLLNGAYVRQYQELDYTQLDTLQFVPTSTWAGTTTFAWNGSDGTDYAAQPAQATLTIQPINAAPTDLLLDTSVLVSGKPAGTRIGTLSVIDTPQDDTHTFALVDGLGSADNSKVTLVDNHLTTAQVLDTTTTPQLYVRVRATDSQGASLEQPFVITVSNSPLASVSGQVVYADVDDGSGVAQTTGRIEAIRSDGTLDLNGVAQDFQTDNHGSFHAVLPVNATYRVTIRSLPTVDRDTYLLPDARTFALAATDTAKTLDPIQVPQAVKHIVGTISYSATQLGVAGATVVATNRDTATQQYATTNASGQYTITVAGGVWRVALTAPPNGADWTYRGHAQDVAFTQPPRTSEDQHVDYVVQQTRYFITGRVVDTQGNPLHLAAGQQELGIVLWDMQNQQELVVYLEPDGTFRIPVSNGSVYRFRGWVNQQEHPDVQLPTLAPREINGSSLELGDLPLEPLQAKITGRITGRDGSGIPGMQVVAWRGASTYHATTNAEGFYHIPVSYGKWNVSPDVGDFSTASYLFEGEPQKVVVSANLPEAQAMFIVSQLGGPIHGEVVDDSGSLVDAQYFVSIVRPNRVKPTIVVPVVQGKFALRMPENCSQCRYRALPAENSTYSIIDDTPVVSTQPDGSLRVTYRAKQDTGSVTGIFVAQTPINGLRGKVLLNNSVNTYHTAISPDGSYTFEHIADGEYTLTYELERADGAVLAQDTYIPFPTQTQQLTVRNGAMVPNTTTHLQQNGTNTTALQIGKPFAVKTEINCPTTQTTADDSTTTLRAYPPIVVCKYASGEIHSYPCATQPDETAQCYTPVVNAPEPQPVCTVTFGNAAGNSATSSADDLALATLHTAVQAVLAQTDDPTLIAEALMDDMGFLARRPQGQTNPRRTKVTASTQRNGEPLETVDRSRDTYIFGLLRDSDGNTIDYTPVQVMAMAQGNDGQVRLEETQDGYYLFEVAQSADDWVILATMEHEGVTYQATMTINTRTMAKKGIVFADLQLAAAGTGQSVVSQSFAPAVGTHVTFETSASTPDTMAAMGRLAANTTTPSQTGTIAVPAGVVPSDSADHIQVALETVDVPSTGAFTMVSAAYRIGLYDRASGQPLYDQLQSPLVLSLPYHAPLLATLGVGAEQVQAATFSYDTLSWTPLVQSSVDTTTGMVHVRLDHIADVVAIIVVNDEPQQTQSIGEDGQAIELSFVLQAGSTMTSTVAVPAGLTVQPGVGLSAVAVDPVAVAEVRVTEQTKPTQQLDNNEALIGGFTVDLYDAQGAIMAQGRLSEPLRLTLQIEQARVPTGYSSERSRVAYLNRQLSLWSSAFLPQALVVPAQQLGLGAEAEPITTIEATSLFAGQFVVTTDNQWETYLPMVQR